MKFKRVVDSGRIVIRYGYIGAYAGESQRISSFRHCRQTHSDQWTDEHRNAADGMICSTPHQKIAVYTADCLPLLVYAGGTKPVIAAIHAGWRGLAKGVIQNTLAAMLERTGVESSDIKIFIGPAVTAKNYEVGEDVFEAFASSDVLRSSQGSALPSMMETSFTKVSAIPGTTSADANPKWHFDLKSMARGILRAQNISDRNIFDMPICTFENKMFASHRRDRAGDRNWSWISFHPQN